MFMHVKPKRAFSALGCVTATRYKIGGSLVTPRFSGLPQGELETLKGTKVTDGLSVDDGGCRWVRRRQVFRASLTRGEFCGQCMKNLYCLASELVFLGMWYTGKT